VPAQLDPQPRDLDRQSTRLDERRHRVGGGAPGAQLVEEGSDPTQRLVARSAEPAVHGVLQRSAQGPEGDGDQ
jgi:hypothetical protein